MVIPVYNAPDLVRRCIDSIYAHVEPWIHETVVQDDASEVETARMLDGLEHPRLRIHHAPENQGFPTNANHGVGRASTPYVLLLNSDTECHDDFLGPLIDALDSEPRFAAVSPGGNMLRRYDLSRYAAHAGCAVSHNLWAYACLIRREVFLEAGGFDPIFGRGYYEDMDLARRLSRRGWLFGVHQTATIEHAAHGSFGSMMGPQLERNAATYHRRNPDAHRHIVLLTGTRDPDAFSPELREALDEILGRGARILWCCPGGPTVLPSMQVSHSQGHLLGSVIRVLRARRKPFRRYTDLWIARDAPATAIAVFRGMAALLGLQNRRFAG